MKKLRLSISLKLLFYFFFLSFICVNIVSAYSYYKAKNALISRTFDQLISVRIEKENRIEEFFKSAISNLTKLSNFSETKEIIDGLREKNYTIPPNHYALISTFFLSSDVFESITFYSAENNWKTIDISDENKQINNQLAKQKTDAFKTIWTRLKNAEVVVLDNFIDVGSNEAKLLLAKRINGFHSEGMLVLIIPIEAINRIMFDNNRMNGLGKSGEVYLVGSDFLMRSTSRFQENSILKTTVKTIAVTKAFQTKTSTDIINDYRDVKVLSSYSLVSLPYLDWAILAEIDFNEAMVSILLFRNSIIYLTIIISLLTLGVVALLSNMITLPIKRLKKETEKIADGKYGKTIEIESNDELGDLIKAFNEMTKRLNEQAKHLEIERTLRLTSMIDGQEIERQRLSRELHDSLGQLILAIKMKLEHALDADLDESRKIISDAQALFSSTAREIRNISNNLMPVVLNEFGLEIALFNLKRDVAEATNIQVELHSELSNNRFDEKLETYIFRICQEALNNITKHARANIVHLFIGTADKNIILEINDDGVGFKLDEQHLSKGNGISNMKERVKLLNGRFSIVSEPEKGTAIKVVIPIINRDSSNDKNNIS